MRVIQPPGGRGSLRWLQLAVNHRPGLLQPPGLPPLTWRSPLIEDDLAEYRDAAFLERLGLGRLAPALRDFWPGRGPQWDALAQSANGVVLVEAKAHVAEFLSPPTQASPAARARIDAAFAMVRADLGARAGVDWAETFYQYANRIAHMWWLRRQGVAADLLFVSFLNDTGMQGPAMAETWQAAFRVADHALGLPPGHALRRHIHHAYPDIRLLDPILPESADPARA